MATIIPITLVGDNLGKRHFYLKTLVNEAYKRGEDFDVVKNIPEQSPIDRLFKIDLASKIKNVGYIIQNVKDEDMLYVSRALKSTWLIEPKFENIINPHHLEGQIYPEMITTAVTKMQHWIHHNLNDEVRCLQFYRYYFEKNFQLAIKFLVKCSVNDIQEEFPKVMYKMNPHYFKILCEKWSHIAKIFFDLIPIDNELKNQYLKDENDYFNTLKHLLKTNADMVLDITEKYFNRNSFHRFSEQQTKFIMKHHKKRFLQKPELYVGWILNMKGIANSLKSEEVKELVLKLARAQYLTSWFSFQSVAPLIKRLNPNERAEFKKKIFVTRNIGEIEEDWPYGTPEPPAQEIDYVSIFDDRQPEPNEYSCLDKRIIKRKITKKCGNKMQCYEIVEDCGCPQRKTVLDKLFDEYRFASFSKTLYELRKRIAAESSSQNRQFMMLVLVSKSGGRPDAVSSLLELLTRHINEPANVRAAIIRSLVKRARVWCLPELSWNQLLQFGQGLGLDGYTPEADCDEGLHAVVIRSLLLTGKCKPLIQNAFLTQFSTLTEYSLTTTEKSVIAIELPKLLLSLAKEKETVVKSVRIVDKLINTLNAYKIKVETYPDLIDTIAKLAEKDISETTYIIARLFDAKIGRRQLFPYTFDIVKTDASYLNALKHDITILNAQNFAEYFTRTFIINANKFLTKLSIYFSEENGLSNTFLNEFKSKDYDKVLGRPLAILLKDQLECYIHKIDVLEDVETKLLASTIRANAHLARPALNIDVFGWKKAGAKHVANRLLICPSVKTDNVIKELLKFNRTAKLALTLSKRTTYETKVFVKLAKLRPTIAIKSGLKLIKLYGNKVDPLIWETMKSIIQELDVTKKDRVYLVRSLAAINEIPVKIKSEYCTVIYTAFKKISFYKAMPPLCYLEILLPDVEEEFIENLLVKFLSDDFTVEKLSTNNNDVKCTCLYIRILVKYIYLSKSEEMQKRRMEIFGDHFLEKMEEIRNSPEKKELFTKYLPVVLMTFKNTNVFLDTKYISPLPVMEKVVVWMQKHFLIHEHFKTFAHVHLSMLYFKAVRQCSTLAPEIFTDKKRKNKEGVLAVGNLFGKYIAREVNNLKTKYFDSIPELYFTSLLTYLETFNYYYVSSDLLSSVIKGILEESKGSEYRLGVYLLKEKYYDLIDEQLQEIKKYVNEIEDRETKWFSSAYL